MHYADESYLVFLFMFCIVVRLKRILLSVVVGFISILF